MTFSLRNGHGFVDDLARRPVNLPGFGILGTFPRRSAAWRPSAHPCVAACPPTAPTSAWCGWPTDHRPRTPRVIGELVNGSAASVAACSELLNQNDIAIIQHEYGIYGGVDGDEIVEILGALRVPFPSSSLIRFSSIRPRTGAVLEEIATG